MDIIGDCVQKDNIERIEKIFRMADRLFKALKKSRWNDNKPAMRHTIVNFFYVHGIKDIEIVDDFLTLVKLNLK